jgi:hypothetical protein
VLGALPSLVALASRPAQLGLRYSRTVYLASGQHAHNYPITPLLKASSFSALNSTNHTGRNAGHPGDLGCLDVSTHQTKQPVSKPFAWLLATRPTTRAFGCVGDPTCPITLRFSRTVAWLLVTKRTITYFLHFLRRPRSQRTRPPAPHAMDSWLKPTARHPHSTAQPTPAER